MAKKRDQSEDLLKTLGDFTSKENWDNFFTIRGIDDSFEWYAEWPQLKDPLLSHLSHSPSDQTNPGASHGAVSSSSSPNILVPGCGNSHLSEHLYDAGYRCITNIDFSKVAISGMLRRNVRLRPDMRWRVMDMTAMQFVEEAFDIVLDKGGLDALMEPEVGSKLGTQYLSEVKRVLKSGGRFICLTLGEIHVLGLLFSKFRFGWKMSLHAIPQSSSKKPKFQTFMVIAEKDGSTMPQQIAPCSSLDCNSDQEAKQASGIYEAVDNENRIRKGFTSRSDITYALEDLQLGVKGELRDIEQGRRIQLTMGGYAASRFSYTAILLDAHKKSGPFIYHCGVFLVPKCRAHEWLFSSEEGQWMVVESSKSARLIMVLLDTSHASSSMDDIQKDLSPLIKLLEPGNDDNDAQIPFMIASDGVKQRKTVHQVKSTLTGSIYVEDVIYENLAGNASCLLASQDLLFRRLTFQRSESLVQSEALLINKGSSPKSTGTSERTPTSSSSSKKRVKKKSNSQSSTIKECNNNFEVDHNYLASSYHTGIISGFVLISTYLDSMSSAGRSVEAVVVGLGAGLLPMFLHRCMPFLLIEVVELDAVVLDVARDYFSFTEDERLKVHIADGLQFVKRAGKAEISPEEAVHEKNPDALLHENGCTNGNCSKFKIVKESLQKFDILVIDVDSSDSSSGMTCPAAEFVEEPFLYSVKVALSEQGLFVVNLVSRSMALKEKVVSRMKSVFSHLFCLELEEDVNDVLFALNTDASLKEEKFEEASHQLEKLIKSNNPEQVSNIISSAKKIKCFK